MQVRKYDILRNTAFVNNLFSDQIGDVVLIEGQSGGSIVGITPGAALSGGGGSIVGITPGSNFF